MLAEANPAFCLLVPKLQFGNALVQNAAEWDDPLDYKSRDE